MGTQLGSASLDQPDYWWYRARASLLHSVLGDFLGHPAYVLDVGSADGPSVGWMEGPWPRVTVDVNPRGLAAGRGVCGSALALPFADGSFEVVGAFDVLEHCEPEAVAMAELVRVLAPGGRLLMSVPAYQWAWSDLDVMAGHHRRYTRGRLVTVLERAGMSVQRTTYAFSSVFPLFVMERAVRRVRGRSRHASPRLTPVSPTMDRVLMGLCEIDRHVLRRFDIPFGSSVLVAAVKPGS